MKNVENNKLAIIIVIIVVLVLMLKGCGSGLGNGGDSPTPAPPSSGSNYQEEGGDYYGPSTGNEIEEIDYDITNEFGAIPVSVHKDDVYIGTAKVKAIELIYHLKKYNNNEIHLYDCAAYRSSWTTVKDLLLDANYVVVFTENYEPLSHLWEN